MKRFEIINQTDIYTNKIFNDYINCFPKLKDFFGCRPSFEALPENNVPRDNALIEHLMEYNKKFYCGEKTLNNLLLLKDKTTSIVSTGQQPGPFIGPLYTIYKTITAVILADTLTKKTGKKFIPVFWIESSDSNIAGISSFFYINRENKLKDLNFPLPKEKTGASFSKIAVNLQDINKFISNIKNDIDGEKKEGIFSHFRDILQENTNFVEFFASLMSFLFSKYGLVLIDPQQAVVQKFLKPIFQKEIQNPSISPSLVKKACDKLTEEGYIPSLNIFPNSTLVFLEENGKREKLNFYPGHYKTGKTTYSKEKLLCILEENPGIFSPNVALRPIAQDFLLRSSIYVAGPNETAYWAQLKELYDFHKISMPMVFPRLGATLIPSLVSELMSSCKLSFFDFNNRLDKKISLMVRQKPELKIIFNYLFPQQVLQERRLNILQFLVKYDVKFIDELVRVFSSNDKIFGIHYLIYL
ncbi:MAG: bacillithiol biosynthesis cysteine-adding enzyme BshC [bacterium]